MKIAILEPMPREIFEIDDNVSDSQKIIELLAAAGFSADYDVYNSPDCEFPTDIDAYDAYLITGSVAGVYEDFDWIRRLIATVQEAFAKQKKIFGICFGHQLISQALGGQVVKADSGYRIGVFDTEIVNAPDWFNTDVDTRNVVYFHQDRVVDLPEKATLIATTPGYENSMYHIDNQVFCMQAHPEQSRESLLKFLRHMQDDISESLMTDAENSIRTIDADTPVYADWIRSFLENA